MELLSVIRRWRYRDHFSIREISRRTGLSRNTVRKYLRSDIVEPKFNVADHASKLDPYADKLSRMLLQEAGRSRKQKRTIKQLHADLVALGYEGSYNRVAAFAREWRAARQREQQTCGRGASCRWRSCRARHSSSTGRKTGAASAAIIIMAHAASRRPSGATGSGHGSSSGRRPPAPVRRRRARPVLHARESRPSNTTASASDSSPPSISSTPSNKKNFRESRDRSRGASTGRGPLLP
jgi:transcriptional regulator with XRE-family HTH domain